MASKNSQTKSQPVQQNNHPHGALPTLSDNDIEELVRFFQPLAEWDRQYRLNQLVVQEDASGDGVPGELSE